MCIFLDGTRLVLRDAGGYHFGRSLHPICAIVGRPRVGRVIAIYPVEDEGIQYLGEDDMLDYANTCFIVMPFRAKKIGRRTIDFDAIYDSVFLPAITRVLVPDGHRLEPRRTDRDFFSGDITLEMFRYLEYSRFVLADITGLNANVFYELGIRHRARQSGTAIFRQVDAKLPFDISHIKAFPYEYRPEKSAEESRQIITKVLAQSLVEDRTDNLIRLAIAQQEQRPRPDVERLLRAAENALRREDAANAVQLLRQAVQSDPTDLLARVKLGILLKEHGGHWQHPGAVSRCSTSSN